MHTHALPLTSMLADDALLKLNRCLCSIRVCFAVDSRRVDSGLHMDLSFHFLHLAADLKRVPFVRHVFDGEVSHWQCNFSKNLA